MIFFRAYQLKSLFRFIAGLLLIVLGFSSCQQETFIIESSAKLRFSADTVQFDTIFSTFGSTTRWLMIYNPFSKSLKVSSIRLAGGSGSMFRINVDGSKGTLFTDVEIRPRDSLYILVAVTINPSGNNNPVIVGDSIIFETNGNTQKVQLLAWGQDIHLMPKNQIIKTQTWTADKPYLVQGYLAVDSAETLTIEAGTKIYFHRSSFMFVAGKIIVNGSFQQPVIFQGDRLEQDFKDIPGQWGAIIIMEGSTGNKIDYAEIRNPTVGIQIGADSTYFKQDIIISNTKILNSSYYGIWAFDAKITAWNDVIADCGQWALGLLRGGDYNFTHCTVSNRGVLFANRTQPSVVLSNYIDKTDYKGIITRYSGDLTNASFDNSIIYGNMDNEIGLAYSAQGGIFNYKFDHCLLKISPGILSISDTSHFNFIISDKLPGFIKPETYNFELDTLAAAKDAGMINFAYTHPFDFKGNSRISDKGPDLGAYERIEGIAHSK